MPSVVIYHNPRCSKSRQTLALLEERGVDPDVRLYLEEPPTMDELRHVVSLLGVSARELLRKKESEYKELGLDDASLDDSALLLAMTTHPKLIERPIVIVDDEKAALGRPPENVLEILPS